jgi:hypothetical protein
MPTILHETWCSNHADEMGEEVCEAEPILFGPDYTPTGYPTQPLAEILAYRVMGEDDARFVLECGGRGHSAISMGPRELRALQALLTQCPDDLRVAVDAMASAILGEVQA